MTACSTNVRLLLLVFVLAPVLRVAAQDIPAGVDERFPLVGAQFELLEEEQAIVRLEQLHFEVHDVSEATQRVRRVVTVLGPRGRAYGELMVRYDGNLRHLKELDGRVRDAGGEVVRKLRRSDTEDYSAMAGYSLYDENRVRIARLYHDAYPYTVEYEYELKLEAGLAWPVWYPQRTPASVEVAVFELDAPKELIVRHEARGLEVAPEREDDGRRQRLRWSVTAMPERVPEPNGPAWAEQMPAVHTAPAQFEVDGHTGNMMTWESFGRWYHELSADRTVLPPDAVAEVQQIVTGAVTTEEKVRRLYEHLQRTTRYVSIQLGLGGWQPFDAEYVYRNGYGDCKALVNYMKALLAAAGIESYPALVRAGRETPDLLDGFPSNQFNHVILYVPIADGAPIWLECTSQISPFDYLGTFTEDRWTLVVRPEGGELVRTPATTAEDNRQTRHAHIVLDANGDALADVSTTYTGNQQDGLRQALARASDRDRDEWLHDYLALPSFEVEQVDFAGIDEGSPELVLPLRLQLPGYATATGARLFLRPNLLERYSLTPPAMDEPRTQPVVISYPLADADTIRYELPEDFEVEAMPHAVHLDTPFGSYHAELQATDNGALVYHRRLVLPQRRIDAEHYEAFRAFAQQVAQADRAQVVLVRRGG